MQSLLSREHADVLEASTVSVIIPCWRAAGTVRRAIASVAAQSLPALEVIAVDDHSDDDTLDTLRSLATEYAPGWMTVIHRDANGGPGPARNAAWDVARGRYLAFLDADDAWHPEKLARQVGWMLRHPHVVMTGHGSAVWGKSAHVTTARDSFRTRRITLEQMLLSTAFLTRTVVLKREVRFRFPGPDVSEDFLLWAEIVASGAPCYLLDVVLAFSYRPEFDPGGYNGNLWAAQRRELAALARLHEAGSVSRPTWLAASTWSMAKYARRESVVRLRRLLRFLDGAEARD
jgi:glycosyltransferase involved in cell wall biosynthesis